MREYYKIGEISKIYNIGKDSLMYYEKIGILNPTRDKNGYRLYSISDIWKLNLIKELRALDFSMKKIKEYIDKRSVESTKNLLYEELSILNDKIFEFEQKKKEVENRIKVIEDEANNKKNFKITVCDVEKRNAIMLNGSIKRDEEADFLIKKLHKKFEEKFNMLGNNNIGSIFSKEKVLKGEYDYYNCVFCFVDDDEKNYSNMVFDEGKYVCCTYKGDYKNKKHVLNAMFDFIESNNLSIESQIIEIYKIDIHESANPSEFITEIQIKVGNTSNKN